MFRPVRPWSRGAIFWMMAWSLALSALVARPASAQEDADLDRARANFQRAIELEQAGNHAAAVALFREVGQVRMTPQVRFHIAFCESRLGRLVAALGGYELALAEADSVGPDFLAEVERNVAELRDRIPKLVIRRGKGAEAAVIELDGEELGESSVGVEVPQDPGPHAIRARAPGFRQYESTVNLDEGKTETVDIELEVQPDTGGGDDGGDGAGEKRQKPKTLAYVVGGIGVAGLVGSGVLFALRQSSLAELEDECDGDNNCPPGLADTYSSFRTYHYGSMVALGVGVVGVGAAVLLLTLKSDPPKDDASARVLPLLGPRGAGAALDVRF